MPFRCLITQLEALEDVLKCVQRIVNPAVEPMDASTGFAASEAMELPAAVAGAC